MSLGVSLTTTGVSVPSVGVSLKSTTFNFPWAGESLLGIGVSLNGGTAAPAPPAFTTFNFSVATSSMYLPALMGFA